jgi:endonuclease YncB( thermonuclease family)
MINRFGQVVPGGRPLNRPGLVVRLRTLLFCLLALPGFAAHAASHSFDARVVGVADGDTITVLDANNVQHRIRLAGIDAPEKGQPFAERSKRSLRRMVMGRNARIEWDEQDRYGRLVGKVWVAPAGINCAREPCPKTLDAGRAQITVGLAWHYLGRHQGEEDSLAYEFDETEARARRVGLWSEPDPTAPWDWRHALAEGSKSGRPQRQPGQ